MTNGDDGGVSENGDVRDLQREFTAWFRGLLASHEMTKFEAAVALGFRTQRSVEVWLRGGSLPSYPNLVAIVRAFGELPPGLELPESDEPIDEPEGSSSSRRGSAGTDTAHRMMTRAPLPSPIHGS